MYVCSFYAYKSNFIHVQTIFRILIHHTCDAVDTGDATKNHISFWLNVGIVFGAIFEWTLLNILPLCVYFISHRIVVVVFFSCDVQIASVIVFVFHHE